MIRRWSHINKTNFLKLTLRRILYFQMFKIFRKVTRFRRFHYGITHFNRRSLFRLKSRRNWFMLHFSLSWGLEVWRYFRNLYKYQIYVKISSFEFFTFTGLWYDKVNYIALSIIPHSYITYKAYRLSTLSRSNFIRAGGDHKIELPFLPTSIGESVNVLCQPSSFEFFSHSENNNNNLILKLFSSLVTYELQIIQKFYESLILLFIYYSLLIHNF